MTVEFAKEKVLDVIGDMAALVVNHHREISLHKDLNLKPDLRAYSMLEDMGSLAVFTARKDSELVGYAVFFIIDSLHFENVKDAQQDLIYIDPDHRGEFGLRFLRWIESEIKKLGANFILHSVNVKHDFSPILTRMGYELCDYVYVKKLS